MSFSRRFYDLLHSEAEAGVEVQVKEDGKGEDWGHKILTDLAVALQKVVCKMKRNQDLRVPYQ
jgi:hypothetical protein